MLRNLPDDGLFMHSIKPHSLDKIERHDFYATVFSTAMKKKWPQRAYIGLYSGPGRAQIEARGEIVETTPLGAVRVPDPFTHYVFVDRDPRCTDALKRRIEATGLEARVTVMTGDVNEMVPEIKAALPGFSRSHGLLSFCFVDPFAANLKFRTLRALAEYRMDFLIVLMLGRDARTNFQKYFEDPDDRRIAELIDCPDWREEYAASGKNPVRFLLEKFDEAMKRLEYFSCSDDLVHQVKIHRKNVFLYSMVFYSRSELGQTFWRDTLMRTDQQLALELPRASDATTPSRYLVAALTNHPEPAPMSNPPPPHTHHNRVPPNQLLAGEYPGARHKTEARKKLQDFLAAGIDCFIDLTEDRDKMVPYDGFLDEVAAKLGMPPALYHPHLIPDVDIPRDRREMAAILDRIDAALAAGRKVYVHCWGGTGRTGMVIGCHLVRRGMTGEAALARVLELWRGMAKAPYRHRSPDTDAQHRYVRRWREEPEIDDRTPER